jgi:regulator of cell morphogenesis and NO signaling
MIDPNQTVASIVLDHSECAAVLQRHRIDYCCRGDTPLAAACRARGLDVRDVRGELERAVEERRGDGEDPRRLSNAALVEHILSRYHAPLRKTLPFVHTLAAKVARVHGEHNPRLVELDQIVSELADTLDAHIDDEEARLFPVVASAEPDRGHAGDLLETLRDEHRSVGELLGRMRTATEEYAIPDWACTSYRTLFRELEQLENDVLRHVHLENHVLLPRFAREAQCE